MPNVLSRNPLPVTDSNLSKPLDIHVHMIVPSLAISDAKLSEIVTKTDQDKQLTVLQQVKYKVGLISDKTSKRSSRLLELS